MAYNRYQGNTGRVVRVETSPASAAMVPHRHTAPHQTKKPPSLFSNIGGELGGILSKFGKGFSLSSLETEDIILLLILYLMYRESGDIELLVTMGGMLFL